MNTDFAGTGRNVVAEWEHDEEWSERKLGQRLWHNSAISKLARNKNDSGGWVSWPLDCIMLGRATSFRGSWSRKF